MQADPEALAQARSKRLTERLRREIETAAGSISFARFMERALYEPELGYYSSGAVHIGARGDFTTAAEAAPLYARCLARQCAEMLEFLQQGAILELGAGSGALACNLLQELAQRDRLPTHYRIVEISPALRQQQRQRAAKLPAACRERMEWCPAAPDQPWQGLVLASEVADALPVHRFRRRDGRWRELGVGADTQGFCWTERKTTPEPGLASLVQRVLDPVHPLEEGYCTELNASLEPWLHAASHSLQRGWVLCIDYGYPRAEYLHPQRRMGTLLCHRAGHVHDDPLRWVGRQDITASVDFTLLAEAGRDCGLQLHGYTTQAAFLLGCGLREASPTEVPGPEARWLLLPACMGERYQVMAFGKGLEGSPVPALSGFCVRDYRGRL